MKSEHANDIPLFWGHGTNDPIVDYNCTSQIRSFLPQLTCDPVGQRSIDFLVQKCGYKLLPQGTTFARPGIRFESYPGMPHSSCPQEIEDLKSWLTEALK